MKKIIALIAFGLICLSLNGQAIQMPEKQLSVRAKICDEKNNPLGYATGYVAFMSSPNVMQKGAVSMPDGTLTVPVLSGKSYLLVIQTIGFEARRIPVVTTDTDIDLGVIEMKEAPVGLEAINVKPRLVVNANRIIFNMEYDPDRATSSMAKMLAKMPLIELDEMGDIIVGERGKKFIVLRKGRVDPLLNVQNLSIEEILQKLPAMGFSTIEIWRNPPQRFASYDYVINVLPDPNNRLFGAVGKADMGQNFSSGDTELRQSVNASYNILRFSAGLGFVNTNSPTSKNNISQTIYAINGGTDSKLEQSSESGYTREKYDGNLQFSVDVARRQFITVDLGYSHNDTRSRILTVSDAGGVKGRNEKTGVDSGNTWRAKATYQWDFKKPSRFIDISYLGTLSPLEGHDKLILYGNGAQDDLLSSETTRNKTENISHRFQLDYGEEFMGGKYAADITAGYLIADYRRVGNIWDNLTGAEDVARYSLFKQNLGRLDGRANFKWNPNRKITIQLGTGFDYLPDNNVTKTTYGSKTEDIAQRGLLLSPSVWIFKTFGEDIVVDEATGGYLISDKAVSMKLVYSVTPLRPRSDQLSNYVDRSDEYNIRTGNPHLEPELLHNLELDLNTSVVSPGIKASFSNNAIVVATELGDDGHTVISTYKNAGKYFSWKANISKSINLNRLHVYFSASGGGRNMDISGERSSRNHNVNLLASVRAFIRKGPSIAGGVAYKHNWGDGYMWDKAEKPLTAFLSIDYRKNFRNSNRLACRLQVNDIFNWNNKRINITESESFHRRIVAISNRIPVSFGVSYSFGSFKVKSLRLSRSSVEVGGFSGDN